MSNSSFITNIKTKVIAEMIDDEAFFYAINSDDIKDVADADQLVNTHIFRYNQNPNSLAKTSTFISMQAHIQKQSTYKETVWVRPVLEFFIYSHEHCMKVDNIPKIRADRIDYISQLIDTKFNGRTQLGIASDPNPLNLYGELELITNEEYSYGNNYLCRHMKFLAKDINALECEDEEEE